MFSFAVHDGSVRVADVIGDTSSQSAAGWNRISTNGIVVHAHKRSAERLAAAGR